MKIEVSGQPARTDRRSRGFGSFVAKGQWNSADHSLEMDVRLEKSELSDMLSLFEGGESSLMGNISGDAHLGRSHVENRHHRTHGGQSIHGWNQLPPGGDAWPFTIGGTVNAPGQVIELQASGLSRPSPIGGSFHVQDYLGRPRWAATVTLDGVPVAPLTGMARNFGIALPADLTLDGTAQGVIEYFKTNDVPGMQGQVRISGATLAAQGTPALKIATPM